MSFFQHLFGKKSEYDKLAAQSLQDLKAKTAGHQAGWGMGTAERWDLDQEEGRLIFTFPDKRVVCPAQIVGSWNAPQKSWLWAWQNPSILPHLAKASEKVRDYGTQHGMEKLTIPKWEAAEEAAWEVAAITCYLNEAQGIYRGPAGNMYVFIVFNTPQISRR
jgi:hypothetical protein